MKKQKTLQHYVDEYAKIGKFLNERWPLKSNQQRVFARTMKLVEELGELADEILTSMNLQRKSKIAKFSQQNVEDEFADVLASVLLLGNELGLDVEEVLERKIQLTKLRFGMSKKK
ncbi:MAG: MazG-like family protein [Patescibacteria group bacterium]